MVAMVAQLREQGVCRLVDRFNLSALANHIVLTLREMTIGQHNADVDSETLSSNANTTATTDINHRAGVYTAHGSRSTSTVPESLNGINALSETLI